MGQHCNICTHINRLEIDRRIVESGNISQIAKEFGVEYGSLYAHSKNHVARQLVTAMEQKNNIENFNLLSRIEDLVKKAEDIFVRNYKDKKDGIALKALDSQRHTFELFAKISYSLHQAKQLEHETALIEHTASDQDLLERAMKKLNFAELEMLEKLLAKMNGETERVIISENSDFKRTNHKRRTTTPENKMSVKNNAENADNEVINDGIRVRKFKY